MLDGGSSDYDPRQSPPPDAAPDIAANLDAAVFDTAVAIADAMTPADLLDAATPPGALVFDGVNDVVELPTAAGAASETAFSIEVWFNTTDPTGAMFEVYGRGGGADRFIFLEAGKVCFYVYGTPVTKICSPTAGYNDAKWHHAAGTLGVLAGTKLYIDAVESAAASPPTASNFKTDTNFRLGYGHIGFSSALYYYAGRLSEVRVWSVERTSAEILANYKTHLPGNTVGLQGYWMLDQTGATAAAMDATAGAHHGALINFGFTSSPWAGPGAF
ncbi:MAG: LamG domain-containing protein [Deltaproteobacteria bacterium]|nr:LamG domain-containing protein [Deltaproteobacteria bacterium]